LVISALVNGGLFGLLLLVPSGFGQTDGALEKVPAPTLDTRAAAEEPAPLTAADVTEDARDTDAGRSSLKRKDTVTVPGEFNVKEPAGVPGAKDDPLVNSGAPSGLGRDPDGFTADDAGTDVGKAAGFRGGPGGELAGTFYGRSGSARDFALREGGGTAATEEAVARGLAWLARHQAPDGRWSLHGSPRRCNCGDHGSLRNDIAATAFGLLPFLGAGHTHKPGTQQEPNPYQKTVLRALQFLMRQQDKRTGNFGGGMYAHGLAAIALCEAYGLTQDRLLKHSAQEAVDFIVRAQHPAGGWRYRPREAGDTSVVGWQVMALKSAQMANLKVPPRTMKCAEDYLDGCMNPRDGGYGYTGKGSTPTTTAVGLLCRQYLQGWGPATPAMARGVDRWLKPNRPGKMSNMYYYYYATQVMHHLGGKDWQEWNASLRDILTRAQDLGTTPRHEDQKGSWSPEGDTWGSVGGRLMLTSLSVLTLEVYYRHLPLYGRTMVSQKDSPLK
jgi:hypothetical protein